MNDSNQSLRFSRSYQEATGKRLHSRDFLEPEPIVTAKEVLFWSLSAIAFGAIVAVLML